jgi:hypothetical protein
MHAEAAWFTGLDGGFVITDASNSCTCCVTWSPTRTADGGRRFQSDQRGAGSKISSLTCLDGARLKLATHM